MDEAAFFEAPITLGAAYLLALPVGWERRNAPHGHAGLRTFPLVSVGAAAYLLLGLTFFADEDARVMQGLMTGIGFIGGGTMIKHSEGVEGIATAAAIWNTGAIGAAVAYRAYGVAVSLSIANLLILHVSRKFARRAERIVTNHADDHDGDDGPETP